MIYRKKKFVISTMQLSLPWNKENLENN